MRSGLIKAFIILFLCVAIFGTAGFVCYRLFVIPKNMAKKEKAGPPPTPPPDPSLGEFEKTMAVKNADKPAEARAALQDFIDHYPDSTKLDEAKDALGEINMTALYSTEPGPDKTQYVIQKGDTIGAIERKTKIPGELIMRLNKIDDPTKLHIGQVLNVSRPEFSLNINRKKMMIVLINKGRFFKQYRVN